VALLPQIRLTKGFAEILLLTWAGDGPSGADTPRLALRWTSGQATDRITQDPTTSSNFEQVGLMTHLHIPDWRRTRAAERQSHPAST